MNLNLIITHVITLYYPVLSKHMYCKIICNHWHLLYTHIHVVLMLLSVIFFRFVTIKNKQFCGNPKSAWVKRAMKHIDQKSASNSAKWNLKDIVYTDTPPPHIWLELLKKHFRVLLLSCKSFNYYLPCLLSKYVPFTIYQLNDYSV